MDLRQFKIVFHVFCQTVPRCFLNMPVQSLTFLNFCKTCGRSIDLHDFKNHIVLQFYDVYKALFAEAFSVLQLQLL